jgi:hypothetical protein
LVFPPEIYAGIVSPPVDLLSGNRAEIGERLVVVNRANVISPTVGEIGAALSQE